MDETAKRHRIEQIDSEVKQLHPLLESILKKLPEVIAVEYTHGPNEMGADFVVERNDVALGQSYHIGVIAKCDKVQQNFQDIERQISECHVPRLIRNGAGRVRLSEIWVITSKSISQNAKEKIEDKFGGQKIHFFQSDWLAVKVDQHAPYFWDQLSSSIGGYLTALDKRMNVISSQTAIVQAGGASPAGMELDVEELEPDRYAKKSSSAVKRRLVNIKDEVKRNKISYLEAEMGFGKSHLLRQVVSHYAESRVYKESKIIPVYSSFQSFLDRPDHDVDLFVREVVGTECYADAVRDEATFMLALDGVDEAARDIECCKNALQTLVSGIRASTNLKLILTSRPIKLVEDVANFNQAAVRYGIRPLSIGKIISYIETVLLEQRLPTKLMDDIANSELFRQLPRNPIAATLLANIIQQEQFELPSNLTELYAKTMELMLGRWDEKRGIATERLYKGVERLARHLARHMIDNQLIYMSRGEVRQMFQKFLADRNIGVPLEEIFDYLVARSGILGQFDDTDSLFFRHRSFAEYLYALDAYQGRHLDIDVRAFQPYWVNVYYFYLGSLSECPDVLKKLIAQNVTSPNERMVRLFNMGNYLLAAYHTPYCVIEDALDVVFVEAAKVYIEIRDGVEKTRLLDLTEMQLLWFITKAISFCYGYRFFEKALPLTLARIDEDMLIEDECKSYALFFAASALAHVENTCGYEFILKGRETQNIPLPISLALRCEMEQGQKSFIGTPYVKRFNKKLKKLLYADPKDKVASQTKMKSLFEEPLSTKVSKRKADRATLAH